MSFLSGIADLGKTALQYAGGDSFGGSLIRTIGLGYAVSRLSSNTIKSNNSGTKNIDQGVRLQIEPDSQTKVPVLYGQAYFSGNIFDARMSADNKTMWYALALSERTGVKLSDGTASTYVFNNVYRNGQRIVFRADGITSSYAVDTNGAIDQSIDGLFEVYLYAGDSTLGQVPQSYTGTVPDAYTIFPEWTALTHPADDLIFAIIKVNYSRDKNVTELGNILFQVENSMNLPGDVVKDYLTSTVYGLGIGAADLDTTTLDDLNTYSATSVAYNDEGTGAQTLPNRYQINGLVDTDENVLENAENLCSAAATWLTYDTQAGVWGVVINKAASSVASFSDANVLGSIGVGGTGLTDLYNSVKVEFPHRDLRDSSDFIKIEIPANERNANEPDNTLVITYDNINEAVQAELLGFIELKQSRVNLMVDFEVDYSYIGLKAGDVVDLTNSSLNFTSKLFRVITVTESQSDDGITLKISALEYDADVYSVISITRFTRSNADGIITIGSIGEPSIPQITKFENNARPRVQMESLSPTGVVEGMEFWLSNDVNSAESARSYTLLTTKRQVNAETFPANTNVIADVDSLDTSEFVIKTRGVNSVVTGPFSDPSVTVVYAPKQVTNAIDPNTDALDNTGALATALGVLTLLNNLDDIYAGFTGGEGLFDVIFDTFKDVTGVDLVGDASGGTLVVSAELATLVNGTVVTSNTNSYDFVGGDLIVSKDVDDNITIDFTNLVDAAANLPDGKANKDILAWDENLQEWRLISDCITCEFPEVPPDPLPGEVGGPPIPCMISIGSTLPSDKAGWTINDCENSDVPISGPYYISYGDIVGSVIEGVDQGIIPWYAPLTLGSGSISLYTSDGTLQQSVLATSCSVYNNVLEIPFGNRDLGTDYYIIMDEGIVTTCDGCVSPAIDDPTVWNFTTSSIVTAGYGIPTQTAITTFDPGPDPTYSPLTITSITPNNDQVNCNSRSVTITFSEAVKLPAGGSADVFIEEIPTGNIVASIPVGDFVIVGNTATSGPITAFESGGTYRIIVLLDTFETDRQDVVRSDNRCSINSEDTFVPPQDGNAFATITAYIKPAVTYDYLTICSGSWGTNVNDKTNRLSNLELTFTAPISVKPDSPANLHIYDAGGSLHQTIDLRGSYPTESELVTLGSDTISVNPTRMFALITEYYVLVDDGVILDSCGNTVTINNPNQVTFKTEGLEIQNSENTPPTSHNADGSQNVGFELESTDFVQGTGKINIYDSNQVLVRQLDANDPAITYSETI